MTFAADAQATAALAALVVMLPATLFAAVRRWGMPAGYNVAFASYWLACGALAFAVGGTRVAAMLAARTPSPLQIIVLAIRVIGALVFALIPQWRHASGALVARAAARALPNAVVVWTTAAHFLVDACGLDAARASLTVPTVGRQAAQA